MDSINLLKKYFPEISEKQLKQFEKLSDLYLNWNEKINVISRKDIHSLYEHHILHSLSIAKFVKFKQGTKIIDVGTGGGFPGIPLAIFFPEVQICLVDSKRKKIKVVDNIIKELGLENACTDNARSEQIQNKYDFVLARAVSKLPKFVTLVNHLMHNQSKNPIANGIIYLKGGNIEQEIAPFSQQITIVPLQNYFEEDFFEAKKILYLPFVKEKVLKN